MSCALGISCMRACFTERRQWACVRHAMHVHSLHILAAASTLCKGKLASDYTRHRVLLKQ